MIEPQLLEMLRCPHTGQKLALASPELLASIQALHDVDPFEAALVRADREVAYPVREGIPVLLIQESMLIANEV